MKKINLEDKKVIPGSYNVKITSLKEKITDNGRLYLLICYKILDGEFKDETIFDRIWSYKENNEHNKIALKELLRICGVEGKKTFRTLNDVKERLINCRLNVYLEENENGFLQVVEKNEI